uniref:adenylate kinase n=1 Tax=Arundo donax TaxID=35708 RepID=A0A0A9DC73_ARUDO
MVKRLLGRNQGRVDDNIETIKKRLKVFESLNIPVIDYYSSRGKVHKINATGTAEEIFEGVRKLFSNLRLSSSREPGVMLSNTHVLSMKTVPTLVRTQKVFSLYCSFTHVHLWHGNCRYTHGPHLQ